MVTVSDALGSRPAIGVLELGRARGAGSALLTLGGEPQALPHRHTAVSCSAAELWAAVLRGELG